MNRNPVGWFEIPVVDMNRAMQFYNKVFNYQLESTIMGPLTMAFFPWNENLHGAPGALVFHQEFYRPSESMGILIYFSCTDVADVLDRVRQSGGTVLIEKRLIADDVGYMGLFLDSDGNRIGLHSRN